MVMNGELLQAMFVTDITFQGTLSSIVQQMVSLTMTLKGLGLLFYPQVSPNCYTRWSFVLPGGVVASVKLDEDAFEKKIGSLIFKRS